MSFISFQKEANLTVDFFEAIRQNISIQWETSYISLVHKNGEKDDRSINLMSNDYKVFLKIIFGKIAAKLDENRPGFFQQ